MSQEEIDQRTMVVSYILPWLLPLDTTSSHVDKKVLSNGAHIE
jgi:hypothetical protein